MAGWWQVSYYCSWCIREEGYKIWAAFMICIWFPSCLNSFPGLIWPAILRGRRSVRPCILSLYSMVTRPRMHLKQRCWAMRYRRLGSQENALRLDDSHRISVSPVETWRR